MSPSFPHRASARIAVLSAALIGVACLSAAHAAKPSAAAPAAAAASAKDGATDVATRLKAFNALVDEQWEGLMRELPEQASFFGDYRYNDAWSDFSLAGAQRHNEATRALLARFKAVDTRGFPESDLLNHRLMVRWLENDLQGYALKTHEMPLDQFNGTHLILTIMVKAFPFNDTQQYDDYLKRLREIPRILDQVTQVARQGAKDGLMQPRYLLDKVAAQCNGIADAAGEDNVFAASLKKFPDSVPAAERERLRKQILEAVDQQVRPAYRQLAEFVSKEYAPQGREQYGVWSLSGGEGLYRYAIEQFTTSSTSPEKIHQLGLSEVTRIEKEQTRIAKTLGYADLKSMREAVAADPKRHATSREQILDLYREYLAKMETKLPELFATLPTTQVQVQSVEAWREKEASAAQYMAGTPDGKRPGLITVNTGEPEKRLLTTIEAVAYHEGVPGHHLQLSMSRALPELPKFRTLLGQTAFIEGWGLYSEDLGKEVGFYQDPYSDFGRLSQELIRANRLVLDTGVHYKRWTREQMVQWMRDHSDMEEPNIQAEADRYIAWPGQALAYKMGQLKIRELRARAQAKLGKRFDRRVFHDQILGGGALPLRELETRIDVWIAATQRGAAAKAAK
ncbi:MULTISPECIES: DUF885 domain-containing protein [Lysobacter]|uniref:DUF885 domain-containing protein n=1 Tax=Lysobacter TaxID=68 RepID=UPI001F1F4CB6|nr:MULTISPECIES: DUF885 family protein [Lysobacter]UJB18384.1 DUF885 family protein [Lysobacter capsici]UJQ27892.1 DUF885 family protein [Lysobacter gummosus]